METAGFRRRILIEPGPSTVSAELEDDWHRMVVTLHHRDGTITRAVSDMKRWPWTTCRGAIDQLAETFCGVPLAEAARRGERTRNCTHLHDLALFAAAHAHETLTVAYDVRVSDPVRGRREARLARGGRPSLAWTFEDDLITEPAELAGRGLADLSDWIANLPREEREAARILRWAAIMAYGRAMVIETGTPATRFAGGACYTFQPERAARAVRRPAAHRDLSSPASEAMADRASLFPAAGDYRGL